MQEEVVVQQAVDTPKKKHGKILRSTSIVASMTMISRVMGFIRDVVLAVFFGASPAFDAFVVAFKLPNFMRRLFAEGAFSQAFVPVLAEYRSQKSHHDVLRFLNHIAGSLSLILLIVVVFAEIFAPSIITVFAPGFLHDPVRFQYATHMLYITFPYLLLVSLTAFSGAILNTYNRFALAAVTPVVLNVVMIAVTWWWAPHSTQPIYVLAWGVLLGGVCQLLLQVPFLGGMRLLPKPIPIWKDPGVRRVLKLMVPALFGVSVAQLSLVIDNFFASFLPAGSISWLYYSDRLIYLPQGVIGVALATVVLPSLSRHHADKNGEAYSRTLDWALRACLLVGIPAALGLCLLSGPILATLIHHGAFNDRDVLMTTRSLRAFTLGLPAFMAIKILASGFYSRQNIKTPVKVAAFAVLINLILNVALIYPLAHAGLALSTSLASIFNAVTLFVLLWRYGFYVPNPGWKILWVRLLTANALMGSVLFIFTANITAWLDWGLWTRIWHLIILISVAALTYALSLFVLGLRRRHIRPHEE